MKVTRPTSLRRVAAPRSDTRHRSVLASIRLAAVIGNQETLVAINGESPVRSQPSSREGPDEAEEPQTPR
jgi:hypothetical protein